MSSASRNRSSVAAELVLALSKPKGKVIKEEDKSKSTEKVGSLEFTSNGKRTDQDKISSSQGNNDWISFLKTQQGNENSSPSPASKTPSRKVQRNVNVKNSSPKVTEKIKGEPLYQSYEETPRKEKETDKDMVLKSLMDQVSSLETTLGGKIQNLEASLKLEKSKCKQLETSLDKEVKLQLEASSKLMAAKKNHDNLEKELRIKIDDLTMYLEEEKKKGSKMASDFAKHKVESQEALRLKDVELIEIFKENEELRSKMNDMIAWKEELTRKVSDGIQYCRINHTDKLQTVIDENLKLRSVMKAAKENFKEITNDISKTLDFKSVESAILKSQVCSLKEDLTSYRQKLDLVNVDSNYLRRKEFNEEDNSTTDVRDEEMTTSQQNEETSRHTSRKRKRALEDMSILNMKISSHDKAQVPDDEVECLSENNQLSIDKNEIEQMRKTKESLRDAILSKLSCQDKTSLKISNMEDQSNYSDESLLQSPEYDSKVFADEAKSDSSHSVTLNEDVHTNVQKKEALSSANSRRSWILEECPNKKARMDSSNPPANNFYRLINECEENKEEVQGEDDDVNLDLLYGDLEVSEETERTETERIQSDVKSDFIGAVRCELDESFGSLDSNELVIDLDQSCESLSTDKGPDISGSSCNTIKELLVGLVNSI